MREVRGRHSVQPGSDSISRPGPGPVWPEANVTTDIATAPVDPSDPELRAWFVERTRQIQAEHAERGLAREEQRPIPDFVARAPATDDDTSAGAAGDASRSTSKT